MKLKSQFTIPKERNQYELKERISKIRNRHERFGETQFSPSQKIQLQNLEKRLEWTEHKAPPVPILAGSKVLGDTLYLYGVDFMSTQDVRNYFRKFQKTNQ